MKYLFCLNARPSEAVSIADKHNKLICGLTAIDGVWGLEPKSYPAPDPGKEVAAHFSIGKQLRGQGIRGFVNYRYRAGLREDSGCDDYIDLEFNPRRIDFGELVEFALPRYIAAFDPYFGYVADEEFTFLDFDRSRNMNRRNSILRVYPICYLSKSLCAQALGISPDEISSKLVSMVKSVSLVGDGVLVIGHTEPMCFASAKTLSDELTSLIGGMNARANQ